MNDYKLFVTKVMGLLLLQINAGPKGGQGTGSKEPVSVQQLKKKHNLI